MQNRKVLGIAVLVILLLPFTRQANADIILDMDASTPFTLESGITVTSGTTLTIKAFYVPSPFVPAFFFDAVALDLSYKFPGDTASAVAFGTKAGPLSSLGAPLGSIDYKTGFAPVTGGTLLGSFGLPSPFGVPSFGGAGYFDGSASHFTGSGESTMPHDLMGWDVTVTGAPGDKITFAPSGVFASGGAYGPGTKPFGVVPPFPGGDALYDSASGATIAQMIPPIGTFTVTIAVPEPTSGLFLGSILLSFVFSRRCRTGRFGSQS